MNAYRAPVVRAIVGKELREYSQNRMILITAILLPLTLMVLPMANLALMDPQRLELQAIEFAVGQAVFCFFLTPIILPAAMAAFTVIGERDQGTIEPLLTLPVEEKQFLFAKVLAIVIPTVAMSVLIFGVYVVYVVAVVEEPMRSLALDWRWFVGVLGLAGPLAVFSTLVGMMMSSRAKDIRVAEHLSGLILLPSAMPFLLVGAGVIPRGMLTWVILLAVVMALNAGLALLNRKLFDRERVVVG